MMLWKASPHTGMLMIKDDVNELHTFVFQLDLFTFHYIDFIWNNLTSQLKFEKMT